MSTLRSNWYRIVAIVVGPAAALMTISVTRAFDDVFPG